MPVGTVVPDLLGIQRVQVQNLFGKHLVNQLIVFKIQLEFFVLVSGIHSSNFFILVACKSQH